MTETAPRPRQVTLASVVAGLGAVLVLINIFTVMADWGSDSIRDEVAKAIQDAPFGPANISVDAAMEMLRIMLMIVGVAYHVLPRFSGCATRGTSWARTQLGCHLLALALIVLSLGLGWPAAFAAGGLLMALALGLFAWTIWPSIRAQQPGGPLSHIALKEKHG